MGVSAWRRLYLTHLQSIDTTVIKMNANASMFGLYLNGYCVLRFVRIVVKSGLGFVQRVFGASATHMLGCIAGRFSG